VALVEEREDELLDVRPGAPGTRAVEVDLQRAVRPDLIRPGAVVLERPRDPGVVGVVALRLGVRPRLDRGHLDEGELVLAALDLDQLGEDPLDPELVDAVADVVAGAEDLGAGDESGYFRRNVLCHCSTLSFEDAFSFENECGAGPISLLCRQLKISSTRA